MFVLLSDAQTKLIESQQSKQAENADSNERISHRTLTIYVFQFSDENINDVSRSGKLL